MSDFSQFLLFTGGGLILLNLCISRVMGQAPKFPPPTRGAPKWVYYDQDPFGFWLHIVLNSILAAFVICVMVYFFW